MISFAPTDVDLETLPDGGFVLRSRQPLGSYPPALGAHLQHWAETAPERTAFAERGSDGGWRRLTYGELLTAVRSVGQALLDHELSAARPLMILSDNSVDNAIMLLAAMHVGVPAAPVSPAYSLMSGDFGKLRYIHELVTPGLVFADDGAKYAGAIAALDVPAGNLVTSSAPPPDRDAISVATLLGTRPTEAVDAAFAAAGPDTIAKILFTSGSTGQPKGVINTQGMLCSNQQAIAQLWHFLEERPPVLLDWLPWNHTFGGNHNFNLVLRNGGTMYIDGGKPVPALIGVTMDNLREISPTLYFNVPRGLDMMMPRLSNDPDLAQRFFAELDAIVFAGAALPASLWAQLTALAKRMCDDPPPLLSAWGSTETAPMATSVHFTGGSTENVGLPGPGTEIRLVPTGAKLEITVKGPNVTPGYWRRDDLTAAAFDDAGYLRMGDAGRLADPDDPSRGLLFDGRVAENFKLMSGTWVHVGALRVAAIAAGAPVIQDAVITGEAAEEVGLLVFPSLDGCRSLCGPEHTDADLATLVAQPAVRDALTAGLREHNRAHSASSQRIARALLMVEPPSIDANEITDKGYVNQRAVLARRSDLVARLYHDDDPEVISL